MSTVEITTTPGATAPPMEPEEPQEEVSPVFSESRESMDLTRLAMWITATVSVIVMIYYFGYVYALITFKRGYSDWAGVPPPGFFVNRAWTDWQWYPVIALLIHVPVPFLTMLVNNKPGSRFRMDFARLCMFVAGIVGAIALVCLIAIAIGANWQFYAYSIGHSVDACCAFYGDWTGSGRCANTGECLDSPSATTSLVLPAEFVQLLVVAGVLLLLTGLQYLWLSFLRSYVWTRYGTIDNDYARYERASRNVPKIIFYLLVATSIVCVLLFFGLILFGILPLNIRHTHEYPAAAPVGVQSGRDFIQVGGLVGAASVLAMPLLVMLSIYFIGRRFPSIVIVIAMTFILFVHVFSFATLVYTRGYANTPGNPNNAANSELYCCPDEIKTVPSSQCDNILFLGPCVLPGGATPPATAGDLSHNTPHTVVYAMVIIFMLLDAGMVVLVFLANLWDLLGVRSSEEAVQQVSRSIGNAVKRADAYIRSVEVSRPLIPLTVGQEVHQRRRPPTESVPLPAVKFSHLGPEYSGGKDK